VEGHDVHVHRREVEVEGEDRKVHDLFLSGSLVALALFTSILVWSSNSMLSLLLNAGI
jgi:hypothetical protein